MWNKVIYKDCMDIDVGLPSLPDKSVDLCITDPPWNISYKGYQNGDIKKDNLYNDSFNNKDYRDWNLKWFNEIKRICKRIIISPGRQNLKFWYTHTEPLDMFIHYKRNGTYGGKLSCYNYFDIYLYYGDIVSKPYFKANVFNIPSTTGWYNKRKELIHPSPKNFELWYTIIKKINPKSVIDPFLGSGTTAEACTKLGIKWIGYEIKKEYDFDVQIRLKNCKKELKQTFIKV